MSLPDIWFCTIGLLLAGYAVLDGFDLGAGIIFLGLKKDEHRRAVLNAIGPVWDGNEVWLITFGGALFAAFPHAYATAFSAYYTAFMLLLFALIFRAVSMEFRGKRPEAWWRKAWDGAFAGSTFLATLLFGVAVGSLMRGIPIGADMEFKGGFFDLVGAFPLLVGVFAVSAFVLHGILYLLLKTSGELQEILRRWEKSAYGVFVVLYAAVTLFALLALPSATRLPAAWGVLAVNLLAVFSLYGFVQKRMYFRAFLSSAVSLAALVVLFGLSLYPNLIPSTLNPAWSLTAAGAASSDKTLRLMGVIALAGMPLVLIYTAVIYRAFRGKVDPEKFVY